MLRAVNPSYALRMAGLVYATSMLGGLWLWATVVLLRQERLSWRGLPEVNPRRARREDPVLRRVFGHGIRQYIRRGFHPRDNANEHHAREWFAAHGLPFTEAA